MAGSEVRVVDPDGPLGGLPIAVKENIDVVGLPIHTETSLEQDAVADIDAAIVGTLRREGATFVGKTSSFEVAFAPASTGVPGPAVNPIDPTRIAGGSSGASAATVAMGTVPVSLATDTSGSILVPASFCGVVGYRERWVVIPRTESVATAGRVTPSVSILEPREISK